MLARAERIEWLLEARKHAEKRDATDAFVASMKICPGRVRCPSRDSVDPHHRQSEALVLFSNSRPIPTTPVTRTGTTSFRRPSLPDRIPALVLDPAPNPSRSYVVILARTLLFPGECPDPGISGIEVISAHLLI